jgi:hypothetical protein
MTHSNARALACLAGATAAAALGVATLPEAAAAATRYETEGTYATVRNGPGGGLYTVPNWHFVRAECIQRF